MITVFADDNEAARQIMQLMMKEIDPDGSHYSAATAAEAISLVSGMHTDVLFLDIEMPGINGIDAAQHLGRTFPKLNIIFVTGHPEYARDALKVYCSGFIEKPFDVDDIREALRHLRYPPQNAETKKLCVRCSGGFAIFLNGEQFTFKRKLTTDLFAYLVYKNGAMCTNAELLSVLWDGSPEKADFLRQLVKDMRDSFERAGITGIVVKRHGIIGLNTNAYLVEGSIESLGSEFQWG